MKRQAIKILLLSVSLGWATQSISQGIAPKTNAPAIDLGRQVKIYPATPLKKILWGGAALIGPGDQYMPIPLYGYSVKELGRDIALKALLESAKGNVHVAIAKGDDSDAYMVQGVRVNPEGDVKLEDAWDKFLKDNSEDYVNNNWLIAFTRPLKVDDKKIVKEAEFITFSYLWQTLSENQSSTRLDP